MSKSRAWSLAAAGCGLMVAVTIAAVVVGGHPGWLGTPYAIAWLLLMTGATNMVRARTADRPQARPGTGHQPEP